MFSGGLIELADEYRFDFIAEGLVEAKANTADSANRLNGFIHEASLKLFDILN